MDSINEMIDEMKHKLILHWNCRGLKEFPEAVRDHGTHIKELYLKWNQLKTLPSWIIDLFNVTDLYVYGNMIEELPLEFGQMKQLTVLDLSANRLQHLPTCIGNLINLTSLILNDNFIHLLPNEINGLDNLETLSVSGNKLILLPEWIGSLPKLKELDVDKNYLKELPNRLTLAKVLSRISVRSNRLKYLPLNSFVSAPTIRFDCNNHLNYISYPLLLQLKSQSNEVTIINEINRDPTESCECDNDCDYKNIKLSIKTNNILIELPRQLLKVHHVDENVITSLWELSLRVVYRSLKLFNYQDKEMHTINCVSYNLLNDGPTSVCVNPNCRQFIFTEAWIVIGKSNHICPLSIVALCCCKRCAWEFVQDSNVIANLTWYFVPER